MRQAAGDLWAIGKDADAIVITTNGTIKHNLQAVMGRGCAKEAATRFPSLPKILGEKILNEGNVLQTFLLPGENFILVTFPVKHDWWQKADFQLIARSALRLVAEAEENDWNNVVMPRSGCGNGGLSWYDVEPMLQEVLDDRFLVVTN